MFSFNINIWIHSVFHAKCLIGRKFDDDEVQSDFKVFSKDSKESKPYTGIRFWFGGEEKEIVRTWCRFFRPLTSFISSHPKKSHRWPSSRIRKLRKLTSEQPLTMLSSLSRFISTTLKGSPRRTPEPKINPQWADVAYSLDKKVTGERNILIFDLTRFVNTLRPGIQTQKQEGGS